MINAWWGLTVLLALGLTACNRQAGADANSAATATSTSGATQVVTTPPGQQPPQEQPMSPPQQGHDNEQYAQVVNVIPVRQDVSNPQKVCHDEVINRTVPPKDQHQIAGMAIGAVAGGLLGHMIGGGKGNALATAAGAIGGGYAGKKIEESHQQANVQSEVVRRCSTVANARSKIVAYDVTYVYNGVTRTTRMDHDPGDRVRVEQSVSVVSDVH
ncbi:glycine zipper 2TM domain-containing protein [Dyella sp. M7H15-1]|uniref:glycine zipper 2TM domain-containing protein n=1 Tax=Dyella sp. M7H15-1 TaxID=2501295 RepID=UPI001004DA07|nr:glycine zipper 2TM domain-containing protein [Dyella sp. M7H15-1]QAU23926.1 glycine zipper 2TM domain-containing protein [Dyella sp. M7H15-1]